MKIHANDGMSPAGIARLQAAGHLVDTTKVAQDQLITYLNEHAIDALLVRSATEARQPLVDACPSLKAIGRGGVGMDNIDVLRATFPAGTLSGAPKVHAMELIDQLEPTKRGIYGGACGYLSFAGDMDLAIAIRTGIIKDDTLYVQAAAGVVADSVPEMEWRETEHKARALLRASELVEEGLE